MTEQNYQRQIAQLRDDWGSLSVDPDLPGMLRADNDPTTGILVGSRSTLIAEIINRALDAQ